MIKKRGGNTGPPLYFFMLLYPKRTRLHFSEKLSRESRIANAPSTRLTVTRESRSRGSLERFGPLPAVAARAGRSPGRSTRPSEHALRNTQQIAFGNQCIYY